MVILAAAHGRALWPLNSCREAARQNPVPFHTGISACAVRLPSPNWCRQGWTHPPCPQRSLVFATIHPAKASTPSPETKPMPAPHGTPAEPMMK